MAIHPTAVVSPEAEIAPEATIGPYVVIEGPVRIGPGTRIIAQAYLTGRTEIGPDNVIYPGVVLGVEPQDLGYQGAPTGLRIGRGNVLREQVQVHRATQAGTETVIGDGCYLMNNAHVAHNCRLGNQVIVAGGALLAGHVSVGDLAFVSGNCVVHQHVRIGRLALLRGLSRTSRDVPPFCIMDGTHTIRGLNTVGLRRAGFPPERIRALHRAVRILFARPVNLKRALAEVETTLGEFGPEVEELVEFIRTSTRGVAVASRGRAAPEGE